MKLTVLILLFILLSILLYSFVNHSLHIISLLLILEALILILLVFIFYIVIEINNNPFMFISILTFGACEGALGLSVLVRLIRFNRNDYINSIISIKWFA